MSATFSSLGVPAPFVSALAADGMVTPFAIQAATIPDLLAGRDLCGKAPTGSGKTVAFGVPLIARTTTKAAPNRPTAVVLVPTRELAQQVSRALVPLGKVAGRYVLAAYGGTNIVNQAKVLRRGVDVLVACPGRLQDLVNRGHVRLDAVKTVVIDEADQMADMGFLPQVRALLDLMPIERQTVLFSATLDGDVDVLIRRYQRDPARYAIEDGGDEPQLEHHLSALDLSERSTVGAALVTKHGPTMIFTRTRHGADRVAEQLHAAGLRTAAIHGGRSQAQREIALERFKRGAVNALVATDVAARGIHVDGVELVLHWDLAGTPKDYLHRSGRTGRAGATGVVVTFVNPSGIRAAKRLMQQAGVDAVETTRIGGSGRSTSDGPRPPRNDRPSSDRPSYERPARKDGKPRSPVSPSARPSGAVPAGAPSWTRPSARPERPVRSGRPVSSRGRRPSAAR